VDITRETVAVDPTHEIHLDAADFDARLAMRNGPRLAELEAVMNLYQGTFWKDSMFTARL